MATLIQSKQIEGIVTASVVEGNFTVSGSIIATGSDSIFGSITASAISSSGPIYGVRYDDISGTPNFIGGTGIVITQVGDNITITNTGGGGGVSGSAELISSVAQLNSYTGSNDVIILGLNQFTASIQSQVDSLIAATSSYETTGRGIISGSSQLTSSLDSRYALSGSVGGGSTDISSLNTFTSSIQTQVDGLSAATSSYITEIPQGTISGSQQISDLGFVTSSSTSVPAGTISGSAQITALGFTSGSHTELPSGVISGSTFTDFSSSITQDISNLDSSLNIRIDNLEQPIIGRLDNIETFTSSIDARVTILEGATDLTGSDSQTLSIVGDQLTISSGNTITIPTGSSGGGSVPAGTISGSAQITALGFTSGSHTTLPSGTVSGSAQLTSSYDSRYLQTSTYTTDSASFDSRISDIIETGSVIAPFAFARVATISNGSGSGISWGNYNAGNGSLDFTFDSAQPDTNYVVVTDAETFDDYHVGINSKTVNGFTAEFYDSSGTRLPSSFSPFTIIVYGSTPTQTVRVNVSGTGTPAGTISGSAQITALGFTSGSHTDISSLNNYTSSTDSRISSLESFTSSLDSTYATDSELSSLSSSIATTIDNISHTQIPAGTISGSSQLTPEFDTRYLNTNGDGVVSGSVLRTLDGTGVVSGSVLRTLDGTGVFSGSLVAGNNITINQVGDNFEISSSASGGGSVPAGTVSSSLQTISHLGGTNIFSGSVIGQGTITVTSGSGNIIISGSGSGGSSDVSYDGNRIISNEDLGDLFTNSVNPGTSGSIQDFLNAVFYPNNPPSITTGNQTILEYSASNAQIVQLVATDPEGQSLTFGTASSYTDDLVRVSSEGVMTLNALAESSSFNTDSVGGGHGHLVTVTATDTFNSTIEKDIYIIVTPNEAPVFRETSVSGNIITSVTANLNENSANDTLVKRVFFTDAESDTITITTSSIDNNHFDVTVYGTYLDIRQNTGSLDYEQQTSYSFSITASDEHYQNSQDSDSRTFLPVTINVTDNLVPVVNSQVVGSINENSSNGVSVGTISATDNEGDSISFVTFDLHKLLLDGVEVSSGSYSGTSQLTDPHENPFQMDSSGNVTRKTGVLLNSDLINQYQYRVKVRDNYNATISSASVVSINITDDTPATLSDNWSAGPYIKESETSSTTIKSTNYGSTQADYGSNQSGTWSSSNPAVLINSNGSLSLGVDLSGSVTQSGDTLDSTITFTNTFGTTTTDSLSVTIVGNSAPTANFSNSGLTGNYNTNLATDGTVLLTSTISDTENDVPYQMTIGGTNGSSFIAVPQNSNSSSWEIQANGNLSAGSYSYDVTVTDSYSESTTYSRSLTISSADTGTLSTNGTFYIIESATTGPIYLGTNGRGGSQGGVSVSYSPNYGSQVATNFSSSNPLISVDSTSGLLSVGSPISGSGNVSGDLITTTISWTDQYGNTDSSDININVTQNNAPDITFTNSTRLNTNQAVSGGGTLVTISFNDTESDSINYDSFQFTDTSGQLTTTASGGNYLVTANSNLSGSTTYTISATIEDVHGFRSNTESHSFTITQASNGTLTGDTTMYIIESALNGDSFRDATGFGNGNVADVNVTYSPSAGSQTVQSFNSTNPAIQIDSNGNMTLGVDLSGSVTQSGDTITTTITFQDQYGNIGSGSVTANIFGNNAPSVSFVSASSYDTDTATTGSTAGTITISDTESNSPYVVTLGGTDGTKFNAVPQNAASSSWLVQPTASISTANTFSLDITVTDNYGESASLTNESIVVEAAEVLNTMYVYTLPIDGTYNNVTGITSAGSGTPPTPTIATAYGFFTSFVDSDTLGDSTITVSYGSNYTATLRGTASGTNVDTVLDDLGALTIGGSPASERVFVFIPYGSEMTGVPTSLSTVDPGGSSTSGEYVVFVSPDGTFQNSSGGLSNDIKSANIHKLTLDTAVDGYTDWIVIGTEDRFNNANAYVRIVPSSGSVPS